MKYYRAWGHRACTCICGWKALTSWHPQQNKQPIITPFSRSITSSRKARSPWLPCCRETLAAAQQTDRSASCSEVICILLLATFLNHALIQARDLTSDLPLSAPPEMTLPSGRLPDGFCGQCSSVGLFLSASSLPHFTADSPRVSIDFTDFCTVNSAGVIGFIIIKKRKLDNRKKTTWQLVFSGKSGKPENCCAES